MSRFEALGSFIYENGNRIGCTVEEAAAEIARKLNAYQMRVARLKAMPHDDDACPHLVRANLLETENARLKAEVERLTAFTTRTIIPNEELQAQVERLTEAGDELHAFLINYIVKSRISSAYLNKLDDDWHAAKEGNPNARL